MPYYFVQLSMGRDPSTVPLNPRGYLHLIRSVAQRFDGSVKGCWFTREGDGAIAVVSIEADPGPDSLRTAFTEFASELQVAVAPVMTLQEVLSGAQERRMVAALDELVDPVDLASALSFPASDPPSWQSDVA